MMRMGCRKQLKTLEAGALRAALVAAIMATSLNTEGATQPPTLTPTAVIYNPSRISDSQFGWDITMDGDHLIVSDPNADFGSGIVYIYDINDLSNPVVLTNPNLNRGRFDSAMAADHGVLAIGTSGTNGASVNLYDLNTGQFFNKIEPTGAISDGLPRFGGSLDIQDNYLVVGSSREDEGATDAGAAYVFDWTTGEQLRRIAAPNRVDEAQFGLSIDLDDGQFIVGSRAGQAFLYDAETGELDRVFRGNPDHLYGLDVALSDSNALVGAIWYDRPPLLDTGAVYIYDRQTGARTRTLELDPLYRGADFGRDLDTYKNQLAALAAGNDYSPQKGFIFDTTTGSVAAILDPGIELFDGEIFLDGRYALVSRSTGSSQEHAVYIFTVPEPSSVLLLAIGVGGTMWRRRHIKRDSHNMPLCPGAAITDSRS